MNHTHQSQIRTLTAFCILLMVFPLILHTSGSPLNSLPRTISRGYPVQEPLGFNGTRAFTYLEGQCAFGPRPPGSNNLTNCGDYIITTLESQNWSVETQTWIYQDTELRNIMAGDINSPEYILLAHYDTRPVADSDPDPLNRSKPILGANDGASGVATLMELAEVLPVEARAVTMLLFVDAEDSGNYNGWEWIVGSTYFVNSLNFEQKANIQAAVLLDMMGDADLQLPREGFSTDLLVDAIWQIAADLNYDDIFLNVAGPAMIDDHRPFLSAGIPAVDIIDFTYPYWHTLEDTPDKCSASSLEAVGQVIEAFLEAQLENQTPSEPTGFLPFTPLQIGLMIAIPALIIGIVVLLVYRRKIQSSNS
ncbi:MAG: M28 family peptidase [Candidatus Hermodarchaeia archaeon]